MMRNGAKAVSPQIAQPTKTKSTSRKAMGNFDLPLFIIVIILMTIGLVMMFSASYAWGDRKYDDSFSYIRKQMLFAGIGVIGMFVVSIIDYHFYRKKWIVYGLFLATTGMLVYVAIKALGSDAPVRWIYIGGSQFQPSELMKFAIVLLFAYIISVNYQKMHLFVYGVVPFFVVLGLVAGLMMIQPHLSGTLLICAIGFVMIFVGGADIKHLIGVCVVGVAGIFGVVMYLMQTKGIDYFQERIEGFLNPMNSTTADTHQIRQSLITIGSGGLFGLGLGQSRQKYLYLPESQNDFVFAIVCEELGFVGAVVVIILFALLIFRGFYIASKSMDKFGMMLVVGITVQLGLQALLNIAVVTNSIPNTGISLPFFSYGGTALTMQLIEVGIILNISRQAAIE